VKAFGQPGNLDLSETAWLQVVLVCQGWRPLTGCGWQVTVDLTLAALLPGDVKKLLVSGRGVFTKRGASRSL
jgi:hypothetical protein